MNAERRLALAKRLWGWEPHPGQREFLSLALDDGSEPKVLVAACGRRWGKTECLGMDVAVRILTEPDLGQMGVAPTRDQAEALFDSVEEKLRAAQDDPSAVARFPHLEALEIRRSPFPLVRRRDTGQTLFWVRAAGRRGRNLRGRGTTRQTRRFRVIVDERAFVDDAAVEEAIKPMLASVPDGGGQLVEIGSPYGRRGGFYADYLRGERREGRYRAVRLPSSQNPLVDPEYLDAMRAEMAPGRFAAEFLAEFVEEAGAVFPDEDVRAAVCDDDYGGDRLWAAKYVAGIDLGRRVDWTVVCILDVTAVPFRLVEMARMQSLGWLAQAERLADRLAHWGCARAAVDATGIGDSVIADLERDLTARGLLCPLDGVAFTAASRTNLVDGLAIALARRRLRFPPHPALLSELASFETRPRPGGGSPRPDAPSGGHDDCVFALALALRAAAPYAPLAAAAAAADDGSPCLRRTGRRLSIPYGDRVDERDRKEIGFTWEAAAAQPSPRPAGRVSPDWAAGSCSSPGGSSRWRRALRRLWTLPGRLGRRILASAYRFAPARRAGSAIWCALAGPRSRRPKAPTIPPAA